MYDRALPGDVVKRTMRIGVRLLGLALVVFVLTRIQFNDQITWPDKRISVGTIVSEGSTSVMFLGDGKKSPELVVTGGEAGATVRRGVITIIKQAELSYLLVALFMFGPISLISIWRWWMLLRAVGLPIRYLEALRLSFIGFFFNTVVPGLTGGDVVKAFYIARGSQSPYKAFLSVFVDRGIGLFGLAILAAVVMLRHVTDPRFLQAAAFVYGAVAVATVLGCVMFSRRLRRLLRVEQILVRLPLGQVLSRMDQAVIAYRGAPKVVGAAILLSVANHAGIVCMVILIGKGLGIHNEWSHYFVLAPICFMLASIPLVPGGWGMREGAFAYFFATVGVAEEASVSISVLHGLAQTAWYLIGGLVFVARPDRASDREIEAFSVEMQATET